MTISSEGALLLDCGRIQLDNGTVQRIRDRIQTGIEWSELIRLAIPHGLLPVVSRSLGASAPDLVPPSTLSQLNLYRERVYRRNREQAAVLAQLLAKYRDANIRVLPFKGPTLALSAYGDLALREFHDLDLWVHPRDLADAGEVLREAQYRPVEYVRGSPQMSQDAGSCQEEFVSADGKILIDLHDVLQPRDSSFIPDFDQLWERRTEIPIAGTTVQAFQPEDLLINLSVHGAKHVWRRLNWILDVAALIASTSDMDWDEVLRRAQQWRCRRRLLLGMALANECFEARVPDHHLAQIRGTPQIKRLVSTWRGRLFAEPGIHNFANFFTEGRFQLQAADSFRGAAAIIASYGHRIIKADEVKMLPMSGGFKTLYRLTRPIRRGLR